METYSMVLILELNDEICEENNILVSAQTNTPYTHEGYSVSAPECHLDTYQDPYGV